MKGKSHLISGILFYSKGDKNKAVTKNFIFSLGTPIAMDQFGWSESEAAFNMSLILSATGIIGFVAYLVMGKLTER